MMKSKMNKRWMLTVLLGATLIGLGLVGGTWSTSSAETTPTIPSISSMTPNYLPIYSGNATVQIIGSNFISGWPGGPYTVLRLTEIKNPQHVEWIEPLALTDTTFDSKKLPGRTNNTDPYRVMDHAAGWDVVVVNHPNDPNLKDIEISNHFTLIIGSMEFYLPLIQR